MSTAARYLWHQRLAWLLIVYATAVGTSVAPDLFGGLMQCAIIMACVKDSALRGRPIPYSWRLPMLGTWPITVPILEWRARRWWGLAWVLIHGLMLIAAVVVAQIAYVILTVLLGA